MPVLWERGPAPLQAGLVFGVGRRDETFVAGGISHLVEHLAMRGVGRTALDVNASVGLSTTEFTVAGPADRVVEHLERVCRSLASLATDGPDPELLRLEAAVLRAEGGPWAPPLAAYLMCHRYGGEDLGLADLGEPALLSLDGEQVRQWTARHHHRSNAALWLTGPPPPGLTLPLPQGPAVRRQRPPRPAARGPHVVEAPAEDVVGLSLEVSGLAAAAGVRILADRLEDALRHRRGWTYGVELHTEPVRDDVQHVAVWADVHPAHAADAGRVVWEALTDLARSGPTAGELDHDQDGAQLHLQDPRAVPYALAEAATGLLLGLPVCPPDERLRGTLELRRSDVRDALQQALPGALLAVPELPELDLAGVTPLPPPDGGPVTGTVHRRRWLAAFAPGRRLVVGDDGVSVLGRGDEHETVRWRDVLGLVDEDGSCLLVGRHHVELLLDPRHWRRGRAAVAAVRAALPEELQVSADPEPECIRTGARPARDDFRAAVSRG